MQWKSDDAGRFLKSFNYLADWIEKFNITLKSLQLDIILNR
jgi:hypothetical protein